jgi:hypothetical protein
MLMLPAHPTFGEGERQSFAYVVTTVYGLGGGDSRTLNVTEREARQILADLGALEVEFSAANGTTARALLNRLHGNGVIGAGECELLKRIAETRTSARAADDNGTNLTLANALCLVYGSGDALFTYPLDLAAIFLIVLLLGWLPLGILLVFAYSVLWLYLSHLVPIRFVLPITLIGFSEGQVTTVGLKGVQTIARNANESTIGILLGFAGIVVNVMFLPRDERPMRVPFFCLGTAALAYERTEPYAANITGPVASGTLK